MKLLYFQKSPSYKQWMVYCSLLGIRCEVTLQHLPVPLWLSSITPNAVTLLRRCFYENADQYFISVFQSGIACSSDDKAPASSSPSCVGTILYEASACRSSETQRRREPFWLVLLSAFVWIVVACGQSLAAEQQDALRKLPSQATPTPVHSSPVATPPTVSPSPSVPLQITPSDWPTYSMSSSRGGFNAAETLITATSASRLQVRRKAHASATISTRSQ